MSAPDPAEDPRGIGIDIYQSDDYVKVDRIGLLPVLRSVFEPVLGMTLADAQFLLTFHTVPDHHELDGEPSVVNLRGSHGYIGVRIIRDGVLVYQHPHSVREILARPLQQLLADRAPQETHWGFGVAGPGLERMALVRPVPRAAGSADLRLRADRPRRFHLEPVAEPEPPYAGRADLGVGGDGPTPAGPERVAVAERVAERVGDGVVFAAQVYQRLLRDMDFSPDVEEGGFLLGRVFRDRDRPGNHLIHIAEALPAERTGASLLQFTFTGESFLRVNEEVARRGAGGRDQPGQDHAAVRLVGWYHTHLFAATDNLGLSTIDVELHTRTFRQSWHVAGLVNITSGSRQLRVYGWDGTAMHQLPYWVGPPWTP
jgi:hypothetical protein